MGNYVANINSTSHTSARGKETRILTINFTIWQAWIGSELTWIPKFSAISQVPCGALVLKMWKADGVLNAWQ